MVCCSKEYVEYSIIYTLYRNWFLGIINKIPYWSYCEGCFINHKCKLYKHESDSYFSQLVFLNFILFTLLPDISE